MLLSRTLLPAVALLLVATLPATIACGDDYGPSTRRAGINFDYGISVSTIGGSAADNFNLRGPGIGFLNFGFGIQFDELLELRLFGALEDANSGSESRTYFGLLVGIRIHVLPGNVYNWRVPNMLDVFLDGMMGYSELTQTYGTGYYDGLELRAGPGLRGSFDTTGTEDAGGLYWYLTAHLRYVTYGRFELNYTSSSVSDELMDFVFTLGIGVML